MSQTRAVAAEMERYIRYHRYALQIEVVDHLEGLYGEQAVYTDDATGNRRIRQPVLTEFRRRTRKSPHPITWDRSLMGWEVR